MRSASTLMVIGAVLGLAGASVAADPMGFDAPDSVKSWSFHNGPEFPGAAGKIGWNATEGHGKAGCLAMQFSFQGGGNYVQAACPLPKENDYRLARLWLKKPAGNRVTFRAVDSSSQTFQKSADFNSADWQQVEVNLKQWTSSFGGANDLKIHWPLHTFAVLIENNGADKEGTILVDDIEFSRNAPPASGTVTDYIAWSPQSRTGWGAIGGQDNAFANGTWNYAFFGQSTPSIATEFSLLGQPTAMRLFILSDGSGHELSITLGSHFQSFRKQIGRLDTNGPQVIEVPLGDMKGWEHTGGENDGQVRYPLRITGMSLKRRNGPERGAIQLVKIEAETTLPADQKVVLTPDVESKGGNAIFKVEIQNLRKAAAYGTIVCDFRQGVWLARQTQEVDLHPAGSTPANCVFSLPINESKVTEGVFWWTEGDKASDPVSIGMSTPPSEPGSTALDPASPFGVGLYLYRNGGPQARQSMNELAMVARQAGVKWTREEIDWHRTELEPGKFDWSFYDDLVDVAQANGISIYGLLCYWSTFAKKDTPEGVDQYCAWARQVVRHYKGRIRNWEIWNEPNIFFWSGPKELYFSLLAEVYDVIKAEDPDAQVLGCSTAGIDVDFIKRAIAAGAKFDALTIHPYRGELNDLQYIKELRDVKNLVGGRPVWITEMGWPSDRPYGRTERQQASYVARTYLTSVASGAVASVSWYDFRNDGVDPYYNEFNFGMVRSDLRLKPAYRALATIANTLTGMKVVEQIDLGPDAYAFRFSDGKQDVVAVCAPQAARLLAFRGETVLDVVGTVGDKVLPITAEGLHVVALESGMPVYIKGKAGFTFEPAAPPIRLDISRPSPRLGDTVTIRVQPDTPVITWHLPPGWTEPKREADGEYRLSIPAHAKPGEIELEATVRWNNKPVHLPFNLSVQADIVRL
jgi:hypothetical protein